MFNRAYAFIFIYANYQKIGIILILVIRLFGFLIKSQTFLSNNTLFLVQRRYPMSLKTLKNFYEI